MKIIPLRHYVVIEPVKEEEKTHSGIVLPDMIQKEKPEKGKIIAIGAGEVFENGKKISPQVKVEDRVIFNKYGPNEIKVDKKEYLICKEEDILAILE